MMRRSSFRYTFSTRSMSYSSRGCCCRCPSPTAPVLAAAFSSTLASAEILSNGCCCWDERCAILGPRSNGGACYRSFSSHFLSPEKHQLDRAGYVYWYFKLLESPKSSARPQITKYRACVSSWEGRSGWLDPLNFYRCRRHRSQITI